MLIMDGDPAKEKAAIHAQRVGARSKALAKVEDGPNTFLERMRWVVDFSDTKAHLNTSKPCNKDGNVLTRDCYALIYQSINKICRPTQRSKVFVYDISEILKTLEIPRDYLNVLGIVSKNNYTHNIKSMRAATNFEVLKELQGADTNRYIYRYNKILQ
ncbi:hypothetical protein FBU30_006094 [Linnemannia zychae]|nr:hypothetical protein FBU30_006094 [Linnemannia zychae]